MAPGPSSVAVVFPGQGTQAPAMAAPWRDHEAWGVVERAEKVLDQPLAPLLTDPDHRPSGTREAQLAVLLTSLVAWEAVQPALAAPPAAMAGHSLGQVTAVIAAGAVGIDEGLRFAARRAELTQAAADQRPGAMVALLGADATVAEEACADRDDAWLANDNAPGQLVIAGTPEGVEAAAERALALGARRARPLDVGGAFHTPLMAMARPGLTDALAGITLADPICPVVSNHDGQPYGNGAGWARRLVDHVTQPVRFRACLESLAALGVTTLVEVGRGSMIAGLAKRAVPTVEVVGVATPADLRALA